EHFFAVTDEDGRIVAMEETVAVTRAQNRNARPRMEFHLANTASQSTGVRTVTTVTDSTGAETVGDRRLAAVPPGGTMVVVQEFDFRGEMTSPIDVHVTLHDIEGDAPAYAEFRRTITPVDLPDLAVVPESLRV